MAGATYVGARRQRRIRAQTLMLQGSADTVVDPRNTIVLATCIRGAELVIPFQGWPPAPLGVSPPVLRHRHGLPLTFDV